MLKIGRRTCSRRQVIPDTSAAVGGTASTAAAGAVVGVGYVKKSTMNNARETKTFVPVPSYIPIVKGVEMSVKKTSNTTATKQIFGHGDNSVKKDAASSGVGEALKKNRLIRARVIKSAAFAPTQQTSKRRQSRDNNNEKQTGSQSNPLLKTVSIGSLNGECSEIIQNPRDGKTEPSSQAVSQVRLIYKKNKQNNNEVKVETKEKEEEEAAANKNNVEEAAATIPAEDEVEHKIRTLYRKEELKYDDLWQQRMLERHQIIQQATKKRHQSACEKRNYLESQRAVAIENAQYRRAQPQRPQTTSFPTKSSIEDSDSDDKCHKCRPNTWSSYSSSSYRLSSLYGSSSIVPKGSSARSITSSRSSKSRNKLKLYRPRSSCSIPGKANYILVTDAAERTSGGLQSSSSSRRSKVTRPTKLEEELLQMRFPTRYQQLQESLANQQQQQRQCGADKEASPPRRRRQKRRSFPRSHPATARNQDDGGGNDSCLPPSPPLVSVLHHKNNTPTR